MKAELTFCFNLQLFSSFDTPPSLVPYLACIFASCYSHFIDFFSAFQYLYPGGIMHLLLFLVWNFFFFILGLLEFSCQWSHKSYTFESFELVLQALSPVQTELLWPYFWNRVGCICFTLFLVMDVFLGSLWYLFTYRSIFFFFFSISTIASNLDMVTVYLEGFFFFYLHHFLLIYWIFERLTTWLYVLKF